MALDGAAYSPQEFQLSFSTESVSGGNIGEKRTANFFAINVDSVEMPSFNPTVVLDPRTGTGRTAKGADAYINNKGMPTEVSFSGVADTTVLPKLLNNILTVAVGSSPASYDIPYNYTPPELEHDAAITTGNDYTKTLTVQIANPEAGDDHSIFLVGCTLTSLSLSGDMGTDSGRVTMSGTFKTGYQPQTGAARVAPTAHGSTYYYITSFTNGKKIAGVDYSVIQSWGLNLENPSEYVGFQGSDAEPEAIIRAVPEISATMDATVKMDNNTAGLHRVLLAGTEVENILSNHGTWSSASTFGIKASYGRVTSVAFNESAAMYIDVSQKLLAHTSGDIFQLVA